MEGSGDQKIIEYWASFIRHGSVEVNADQPCCPAWSFGSTPAMADHLGNLVLQGLKTATAALVWSYEAEAEPIPRVGEFSILLDGQGLPMGIIEVTDINIVPFDEVDEEQAYLEGEGDRSLAYWREVHWAFFAEECHQIGRQPDAKMPVVCEQFTLVYR